HVRKETALKSSLEIAQEATLRPIMDIAREIGLEEDEVDLYGKYKAKVNLGALDRMAGGPDAKIVCVSAITPTKAGEGKTTTSVSLTQGLGHIGKRPVLCLREPSLGRHERPAPAQHHHRPGRPDARHPPRDGLRHRRRFGDHGDHGHGDVPAG